MDKMTIWQAGAPSLGVESAEGHIHQSPATDKVVGRLIDGTVACRGPARFQNHSKKRVMKSLQASFRPVQYMQCIPTKALLPFVVCQSSLKCDSGVMDNCTAIYCTVSSIL